MGSECNGTSELKNRMSEWNRKHPYAHPQKVALQEKAEIENLKTERVCNLVFGESSTDGTDTFSDLTVSLECAILDAALYAAKTSLPKGSPRRVFIQDLAAALNRRKILHNNDVEKFWELAEDKIGE